MTEFESWFNSLTDEIQERILAKDNVYNYEFTFNAGMQACAERKDKRIAELTDKLFALGAMDEPPCFHCGYSGEGYFSPDKHPCASKHRGESE